MTNPPKVDGATRSLDRQILAFISRFSKKSCTEADFNSLALKIFSYQYERNRNYRLFCEHSGVNIASVKSWRSVPAVPAFAFKDLVLVTFPLRKTVRIFRTSGTDQKKTRQITGGFSASTGRGAHFFDTLKLYEAAALPAFQKYLLPDRAKLNYFFLVRSPKDAIDSSLSYMAGIVNRRFAGSRGRFYAKGDTVFFKRLAHDLQASKRKVILFTTAFSLKSFLDYLNDQKIVLRLATGSRLMETGGFKGRVREISKESLYGQCEKLLGISSARCVSEYGMTELSSQYYDTHLSDYYLGLKRKKAFKAAPAWLKTLVIDPRTGRESPEGKAGLLRHIDLANRGSVMVIQTQDLGRKLADGIELLGRAAQSNLRGCSLDYERFLRR